MNNKPKEPYPNGKFSCAYADGYLQMYFRLDVKEAGEFIKKTVIPAVIGSGILAGAVSLGKVDRDQLPETSSGRSPTEQLYNR